MAILNRVRDNLQDVADFGPTILLRHFGRLRKNRIVKYGRPGDRSTSAPVTATLAPSGRYLPSATMTFLGSPQLLAACKVVMRR